MNLDHRSMLCAAGISLAFNALMLKEYTHQWSSHSSSDSREQKHEPAAEVFVLPYMDAPEALQEEETPPEEPDFQSSRSVSADSTSGGEETGILPVAEQQDLMPQLDRYEAQQPSPPQAAVTESVHKPFAASPLSVEALTQKTDTAIPDPAENQMLDRSATLESLDVSLKPEPQAARAPQEASAPSASASDPFSAPLVSLGNLSASTQQRNAFNTKGTEVGAYFKKVRDQIGVAFYQMVHFHYRSNTFLGSEADVSFRVSPEGTISQLKSVLKRGDPLFEAYCQSVIVEAAPFPVMPKETLAELPEPFLDVTIRFGYDVNTSDEQEKK